MSKALANTPQFKGALEACKGIMPGPENGNAKQATEQEHARAALLLIPPEHHLVADATRFLRALRTREPGEDVRRSARLSPGKAGSPGRGAAADECRGAADGPDAQLPFR